MYIIIVELHSELQADFADEGILKSIFCRSVDCLVVPNLPLRCGHRDTIRRRVVDAWCDVGDDTVAHQAERLVQWVFRCILR